MLELPADPKAREVERSRPFVAKRQGGARVRQLTRELVKWPSRFQYDERVRCAAQKAS